MQRVNAVQVRQKYKPSDFSFEDSDTIIEVYQIGMGRVLYTNLTTHENGEISENEFCRYYDRIESER